MSKKLSYRGMLTSGNQEKIRLKTLNGKKGYRITKFQIISELPGNSSYEFIAKITNIEDPSIIADVKFTDSKLMAVAYLKGKSAPENAESPLIIIFDHQITNQDIFVQVSDADSTSLDVGCNYYIELEQIDLNDTQATEITLRNLRQFTSPGSA